MRSLLTPWPWLVIVAALLLITAATLAVAQEEPVLEEPACSDELVYEAHWERVECYLALLSGESEETLTFGEVAPVALVLAAAMAGTMVGRAAGPH